MGNWIPGELDSIRWDRQGVTRYKRRETRPNEKWDAAYEYAVCTIGKVSGI